MKCFHIFNMFFLKGCTAYEFQIGKYYIRWCHLKGGYWKSYFSFKRLSFHKEKKGEL